MNLPEGYRLERDPDALVLRAADGRFVAAFRPHAATGRAVRDVALEDLLSGPDVRERRADPARRGASAARAAP